MDKSKKRRWLHVPSPAMIVACVALFIAMGGTSYAAVTLAANSVGTKQIKKNAVTSAKIKSAAVTAAKVKDASLTGAKIQDGSLSGAKIQDGSLSGGDLANATVDAAKIGAIPGARVQRDAAISIPSGASSTVLSYDATPDFNVGGVFDPTKSTKMTAPIAGRYLITASARWTSNDNGRRVVALNVNYPAAGWAQIARSSVSPYSTTGTFAPEQTVQVVYKLNAGDYVEVWVAQDSGSALDLMVATDNAVTFSMQWLAP